MHKPININSKTPCTINTISQNQIEIVIRNSNNKYMYKRCQMQYLSAWLITHNIKHPMNKTGSSHTYIIIGKFAGQIIKNIRKPTGIRFSVSGRY